MISLIFVCTGKSREGNSRNKYLIRSEFCDLYAHAQPIFLLCCKFPTIILKTVEVAETWSLLCHVYKTNFLSKSRVCNSNNNNSIRILWPLCTCSVYILIIVQVSIHSLENCKRSCGELNSSIMCDGLTEGHMDRHRDRQLTNTTTYDRG